MYHYLSKWLYHRQKAVDVDYPRISENTYGFPLSVIHKMKWKYVTYCDRATSSVVPDSELSNGDS